MDPSPASCHLETDLTLWISSGSTPPWAVSSPSGGHGRRGAVGTAGVFLVLDVPWLSGLQGTGEGGGQGPWEELLWLLM